MSISFEPSENTRRASEHFGRIARERMRPVSRQWDEREHELPSDFVEWWWKNARKGPRRGEGPDDGMVRVCVQAEELCWGDAGLYLRIPGPALGGAAVMAAPSPAGRLMRISVFRHMEACLGSH